MGFLKFLLKKLHFHRIGNISPCDCTNQWTNWPAPVVIGVGARCFQDLEFEDGASVKTCVENVLVGQRTMEVLQQSRDICEILFLVPQVIPAVRAGRCLLWRNYNRLHIATWLRFSFRIWLLLSMFWQMEFCTFHIIHQSSETLVYRVFQNNCQK